MKLREALHSDATFLFDLKNDKDVRKWSIASQDKIDWDKHLEWLHMNLHKIAIIVYKGKDVGDVRWVDDKEIAIKIDKKYRGLGLADMVIKSLTRNPINEVIIAKIVDGNVPSMRLFIKNDFKVVDHKTTNGVGYYILKYDKKI